MDQLLLKHCGCFFPISKRNITHGLFNMRDGIGGATKQANRLNGPTHGFLDISLNYMNSKRKLNPKQTRVIKGIAEGKTQTDAYAEVYGVKKNVARAAAPRMLAKVSNELQRVLREEGVDETAMVDVMKRMLGHRDWRANDAALEKILKIFGYMNEGTNVKIDARNQTVVEFIEE